MNCGWEFKCCICKEQITGYGCNAQPINNGICCDKCDNEIVKPKRLKDAIKSVKERK